MMDLLPNMKAEHHELQNLELVDYLVKNLIQAYTDRQMRNPQGTNGSVTLTGHDVEEAFA
jgi:hypothetical protein